MASRVATIVFCLFGCFSAAGQTTETSGVVLDERGTPLAGARVYGERSCCPYRSGSAITDERGRFELEHPGLIIHVEHDSFQPFALVLKDHEGDLRITLRPETERNRLSKCQSRHRGDQLVGMRDVRFSVPERGVRLNRVEDVDYVVYGIRLKRKGAALELWFGPTAFNPWPDDKLLIGSSDFSQRNIYRPEGNFIGMDSRGRTADDGRWRHTGGVAEGAKYSNASREEAIVFDRIIDSMCVPVAEKKRHR